MKLLGRLNFRLSESERETFERCYQAWLEKGRAADEGRYAKARIWSRSSFARELLRGELEQLAALLPEPKS